ncbi:threonylcarbamoyl-AMP synthase [Lewinellaceae bacterium SD302]|nr:threonylcarbamoyl-AMP synthase [Lewinellaceae bacterium SD302]
MAEIGTDLDRAAKLLRSGELVGIPTETVYGLAGNALDARAVASIFRVKERPSFDPLIMHLPSLERVADYVTEIPAAAVKLARAHWPGPLTMVFKRKPIVPDLVTSGLKTVAIRVPAHPLAQELLKKLDFPLAAPSANPFGYISPTRAKHVQKQLGAKISYVLDGGNCPVGLESTIVSFTDSAPLLLRKGGLTIEAIEGVLGHPVEFNTHSSSNPQAPGMLAKHYSPATKFYLADEMESSNQLTQELERLPSERKAYLLFGETTVAGCTDSRVYRFETSDEGIITAASSLFATLRELDEGNYDAIVASLAPERGLGRAINDRLRRAAAK